MNKAYRLSCITKNGTNPAYKGARIGVDRVARRMGCEVAHRFPNIPDDIDEQGALLEAAFNDGPDAVLLAPAHPTALNPIIRRIEEAGIPIVFFVSRAEGISGRSFVTSDNYTLARAVADYLIRAMDGRGALAVVEGSANSSTSLPRTKGFLDAIADSSEIRLVARCDGNYQRDDAYRAMTDVLHDHPAIDGVLSANDFMALGVIDALRDAGRQARIVGVNAMPDAIQAIKAGTMQATAAYDAMKMACVAT